MAHLTAPWLSSTPLQHLFSLFEKEGAVLRLVGGSVRDGLLGLPVNDFDLAVDKDPLWVLDLLKTYHITGIPTGIEHGTITAVIDKTPYQITTLRVDINTFGRKAEVAFTKDWEEDAKRRDFTINAIYADKNGLLFDLVGGVADLQNHVVRFIGDASQRIKEDYLRILRFFRFSARFGLEPYDTEGLKACTEYAPFLPRLARERVTEEFLKILDLPSPFYAIKAMEDTKALTHVLSVQSLNILKALTDLEKRIEIHSSAILRLASLHPSLGEVKSKLRLSNEEFKSLDFFLQEHQHISLSSFKGQAYLWEKDKVFDLSLLQNAQMIATGKMSLDESFHFLQELHHQFDAWQVPVFPLTGDDIMDQGIHEGRDVGIFLKKVESWWLSKDFQPDRKACLSYLFSLL